MKLSEFITAHSITADVKSASSNPCGTEWMKGSRHWSIALRVGPKARTFPFTQGPAITTEPTAADLLECLRLDSSGYENARTFETWAQEYGYALEEPKDRTRVLRIYRAVMANYEKLEALLGTAGLADLIATEED